MQRYVNVRRTTDGKLLTSARWCVSFASRWRGLMFRSGLKPGEALVLVEAGDSRSATSIHMFFVPFAIAAVWIDSRGRVVDKVLARPWRPFYAPRQPARYVLESDPKFLEQIEIGDEVVFEPRPADTGR